MRPSRDRVMSLYIFGYVMLVRTVDRTKKQKLIMKRWTGQNEAKCKSRKAVPHGSIEKKKKKGKGEQHGEI